jgi:hypothetical protein
MAIVAGILGLLFILAGTVCAIIVLVRLFQNEGTGKGILGLICGIYLYIWGWMNAKRLSLTTMMLAWTILFIIGFILYMVAGGLTIMMNR